VGSFGPSKFESVCNFIVVPVSPALWAAIGSRVSDYQWALGIGTSESSSVGSFSPIESDSEGSFGSSESDSVGTMVHVSPSGLSVQSLSMYPRKEGYPLMG
jgi:hypothetical protein